METDEYARKQWTTGGVVDSRVSTPMRVVSRTDQGLLRENNQDALAVFPEYGLAILADGMGGYSAGEVASQMAVETVAGALLNCTHPDEADIARAVSGANRAILEAIEENPDYTGMATTIALVVLRGDRIQLAHVGDSRIYRFRDGQLVQLTQDHSMVQELIKQGMFASVEEAEAAGVRRNILVRGVGIDTEVQTTICQELVADGDLYLLCSDGLTDMVTDEIITEILSYPGIDLAEKGDQLVEHALLAGGKDNVSVILVDAIGGVGYE